MAKPTKRRRGLLIAGLLIIILIAVGIAKRDAVLRTLEERMPISMLEGRVRDNPADVAAIEILTRRLMAAGKSQQALDALREATSRPDAPGDVWLMRARAAHRVGDDIDAERSAKNALRTTRRPSNAHWIIGMSALSAGNEAAA